MSCADFRVFERVEYIDLLASGARNDGVFDENVFVDISTLRNALGLNFSSNVDCGL